MRLIGLVIVISGLMTLAGPSTSLPVIHAADDDPCDFTNSTGSYAAIAECNYKKFMEADAELNKIYRRLLEALRTDQQVAVRGWRATFYTTGMEHSPTSATGTGWERTPWHATQRAAWEALTKAGGG